MGGDGSHPVGLLGLPEYLSPKDPPTPDGVEREGASPLSEHHHAVD